MTTTADSTVRTFCEAAWERTATLQQAICDHPFNRALADGSLDPQRFSYYLAQDSQYLVGFSRALSIAAARAPGAEASAFLAGCAHQALVVERSLHSSELERLGWRDTESQVTVPSPACLAYTSYLLASAAIEPWPVLIAALVPCFWVYHHVGLQITGRAGALDGHPYRAWITTYTDEEFAAAVATVKGILDGAALAAPSTVVEQMFEAFTRASEFEWLFWDAAWKMEGWPTDRLR